MKKALRSYLLNLSKQLRLITAQQFIKEKRLKMKNTVSAAAAGDAGDAQIGNVYVFQTFSKMRGLTAWATLGILCFTTCFYCYLAS
jgi:hypothetical protein